MLGYIPNNKVLIVKGTNEKNSRQFKSKKFTVY